MILQEGNKTSTYKPIPAGMHLARCFMYVDIGTQETNFGEKHELLIYFEIHSDDPKTGAPLITSAGDPMTIFKKYTASFAEKSNLRIDLTGWLGGVLSPSELKNTEKILGQWCMLNISNTPDKNNPEKIWDKIETITPVPPQLKKVGLPQPINDIRFFELSKFSQGAFEKLPNFAKNKIMKSREWERINSRADTMGYEDPNDRIPF